MPIDQQPHGIGSYIKKINQEYQNEYNTNQQIINMGDTDATVEVQNTVTKPRIKFNTFLKNSHNVDTNVGEPQGIDIGNGGSYMYINDYANDKLMWYEFVTPYDVSSTSVNNQYLYPSQHTSYGTVGSAVDIAVDPTGTHFACAMGYDNAIAKYTASTAWDITTLTLDTIADLSSYETLRADGVEFEADGRYFSVLDTDSDKIFDFDLGTLFDFTTVNQIQGSMALEHTTNANKPEYISRASEPQYVYLCVDNYAHKYKLSNANLVSSGTYKDTMELSSSDYHQGITSAKDRRKLIGASYPGGTEANFLNGFTFEPVF